MIACKVAMFGFRFAGEQKSSSGNKQDVIRNIYIIATNTKLAGDELILCKSGCNYSW